MSGTNPIGQVSKFPSGMNLKVISFDKLHTKLCNGCGVLCIIKNRHKMSRKYSTVLMLAAL